jgi:hypothetical protein
MSYIRLDTLDRLRRQRHGLFGWCYDCDGFFAIDLDALIAERGANASTIRMAPIPCGRCGGTRTEYRITAPDKASGGSK